MQTYGQFQNCSERANGSVQGVVRLPLPFLQPANGIKKERERGREGIHYACCQRTLSARAPGEPAVSV